MKTIRVLTPNIELLGEISNYESLFFTRSWHGIGELELHINRYKNKSETLQKGNIIIIGKDLNKVYIIKQREIGLDQDGKVTENWVIKALQLKSVVSQRISVPPVNSAYDSITGSSETVMKHYINQHFVNPTDLKRKMYQLLIAQDFKRGVETPWQSRFINISEDIVSLSLLSNLGWNISVDYTLRKWVYDVFEGRDLSVNQDVNNRVIFSPDLGNMRNMSFSDSDLNYKNAAYVAGQEEGTNRRVLKLGESEGLSRYELFVDARDIPEADEDDYPRPTPDIERDLTARGEQILLEQGTELYLEGQVLTNTNYKYEVDYDLGDIVTLQSKGWGVMLDARITEVKEIYEPENTSIELTFGNNKPTIINKVKQELNQISGEVRR